MNLFRLFSSRCFRTFNFLEHQRLRSCISSLVLKSDNYYHRSNFRPKNSNTTNCLLSAAGVAVLAASMEPPRRFHRRKNSNKEELLFDAVRRNSTSEVRQLLNNKDVDVNCRHVLGWTPLHLAAVCGNVEVLAELLTGGADPNAGDAFTNIYEKGQELGISSLDAMFWRDSDFSDRFRLNTNRTTFRGCTPLHYAVSVNDKRVIKALLDAGADPTAENDMGYRPSDYVVEDALLNFLLEHEKGYEVKKAELDASKRLQYPLDKRLRENLVGQEAAIRTVSAAIRRWQSGWADDEHPLVMLFLGSSGIGKTELAKHVAVHLGQSSSSSTKSSKIDASSSDSPSMLKNFIRLDMSEYQERHSVARLIGSPPGYIGHDEGGQLTSKLSACPNAVVLFDEIEKAHPDVLTVLLQLFDEGRLTDGKGKTIACTKAIFIMTSNLASEDISAYSQRLRDEIDGKLVAESGEEGDEPPRPVWVSKKFKEGVIRPILKSHFKRDEFLGRINEFVYFLPFSRRELMQLVAKELNLWAHRALARHGITLMWDRSAVDILADGYNVHYGARSIKYEVERQVIDRLAAAHDLKLISKNSIVRLVGHSCNNGSSLLAPSSSTSPSTSAHCQFERSIRLQVKKDSDSPRFEDINDNLLLENIDKAAANT